MPLPTRTSRPPPPPALLPACAVLAALLLSAGLGALAAPLPAPRARPHVLAPLAPVASTALEQACGANVDDQPRAFAAFAEHTAALAGVQPTPNSADVGELPVLEDDGTFFFTDKGGNMNVDVAATARAFYRTHGDDYDELVLWLSTGLTNWLGSPTALAAAWLTHNDISGIGLDLFNYNVALGLPPRIQTVLTMNGLQRYPDNSALDVPGLDYFSTQDVLAHEFGHHWLAYPTVDNPTGSSTALLGRALQHWSFFFDSDGSVMQGSDWQVAAPDSFVGLEPVARFGMLDQYLMGVRDRAEVDSFFVVSDTATFQPPGPYVPVTEQSTGMTARGPAQRFAIDALEAANGPRIPSAAGAPHHLRVAFALLVPRGAVASAADLAKLETIRAAFPATVEQYTGGRMTLDATLDSHAGRLRLEHEALPATEAAGVPRVVALHATVDQAGIPLHVRPDGVTLFWRADPAVLWNPVPMSPAAPDSFVALLPGVAAGTRLEYRFHAESDSVGLAADLPELSRSLPFRYFTGPDTITPRVTHWALNEQSSDRLPHALLARVSDDLGVDAVWCETSLNGGPLQTVPATRTGRDSFVVSLGAGLPRGARLAYRFVARDASVAGNLGYSNPAFDTLRVEHDAVDDFWNPAPWTHGIVRFNRRDEWHMVESPASPSGSTAWHCGLDTLPYGPYQDAALTSPLVFGIVPGCSLSFVHRYSLEDAPGGMAFDGARVEVIPFNAAAQPVTTVGGYTHTIALGDQGLPQNSPCWSGVQDAWREERIDLSPFAPGPVRVRFRLSSDLFVGAGGWWVDQVRFHFPDQPLTGVGDAARGALALGAAWPNPASGALHQALRLPRGALVEWALYDLAGRRVATLWRGALAAGAHELSGELPRDLNGGLYFARVQVDGHALTARRVVALR